jgi:hypothetical protein
MIWIVINWGININKLIIIIMVLINLLERIINK